MSNDISLPMEEEQKQGRSKLDVYEGRDPEVKIRTKKMLMYLIIFAIVMIFAAFISAYIVNYNTYDFWMHIPVPSGMWLSNGLLVLSSIAAILAVRFARKAKKELLLYTLGFLLLTGVGFLYSQYQVFLNMSEQGIVIAGSKLEYVTGEYGKDYYFTSGGQKLLFDNGEYFMPDDVLLARPINGKLNNVVNTGGVYIFILMAVHAIHLVMALIYLVVNAVRGFRGFFDEPSNVISLSIQGIYWHFMGILWLILFVFLFYFH